MIALAQILATLLAATTQAAVPGLCSAPAADHVGEPGCYLSAELDIADLHGPAYWHLLTFDTPSAAQKEAAQHRHAVVVNAHGKVWLNVLGNADEKVEGGVQQAVIGPLSVPAQGHARFLESWFPPGMMTRTHSHPGTEVFYVVEGEQCVETPAGGHLIGAGEHYVLKDGPHLQAAPGGRRNLVLLLIPGTTPWMQLEPQWKPTGFCTRDEKESAQTP